MRKFWIVAMGLACVGVATGAQAEGIGVGLKLGTLGAGLEVTKGFTNYINGRASFQGFSYDYNASEGGVDYEGSLDLSSGALFLDWHPFKGSIRFTLGGVFNNNEMMLKAEPAVTYNIGGTTYTVTDVGTLKGAVAFDSFSPYVGMGWGNAVEDKQFYTVSLDIGVLFQGSPAGKLTADGLLATNPAFLSNLKLEEEELNDSLKNFQFYPVISLGLAYHF